MYFLHLVLTFTPHYIIMVKGLFSTHLFVYSDPLRLVQWSPSPTGGGVVIGVHDASTGHAAAVALQGGPGVLGRKDWWDKSRN